MRLHNVQLVLILILLSFRVFSLDLKYPVSAIAPQLKEGVNVVIREDQQVFKILSKSQAIFQVHRVITILNDKGNKYASEVVGYDKLSRIVDFNGYAYDATGKQIKRLKNSEIYDQSAVGGGTLASDARLKAIDLSQATYPYTIEYDYEVEYKYLFMIPGTTVIPEEKVSVQHASYSLIFPSFLPPRYKALNIAEEPLKQKLAEGRESVTWTFNNLLPITFEPYGPPHSDLLPEIIAAPSIYEYDGYDGMMDTWEHFGQWIGKLNKGKSELSPETKKKLQEMTADLKTTEQKIKAVYEYMQNKTRYVSIQLGIGGFQPFEASLVDKNGYGDCKALSNYMVSMLGALGIPSNYVLIRAGDSAPKMKLDFSSSQFNHAVVAVPNGKDTLWLECTSQTNPFGYMGNFTGDRKALAITESGAKVVRTPVYTAEQNVQSRSAEVVLDISGDAKAKVKTTYKGLQYENGGLDFVLNNPFDDQKKWLLKNTSIPSFDVNSFSMINVKNKIPAAVVSSDLTLRRYASVSGKRVFLQPNLMNRSTFVPEKSDARKMKIVTKVGYIDIDTITYKLPEVLYPEFMPNATKIASRFGEYESNFKIEQGNLIYIRRIKINKGEFPPDSYQELTEFYKSVSKADNTKIVFLNKT